MKDRVGFLVVIVLIAVATALNSFYALTEPKASNEETARIDAIAQVVKAVKQVQHDRIVASNNAFRQSCLDDNAQDATTKEVIESSIEGIPAGVSPRVDRLRARADSIVPRDCDHLDLPAPKK